MKTKVKKLLATVLCLITVFSACPVLSFADSCQHTNYEWVTAIEATETADGQMKKVCLDCEGEVATAVIEKGHCSHKYFVWNTTVNSTCTTTGLKVKVCNVCNNEDLSAGLDNLGYDTIEMHSFIAITSKEPTCTTEGSTFWFCTICFTNYKEILPVDDTKHDYLDWVVTVEPTCTQTGLKERKCNRYGCGHVETEIVEIDETAHICPEDAEFTLVKAPTCEEPGVESYTCEACKETATREIPCHSATLIINENGVKVPANCSATGIQGMICTECGYLTNAVTPIVPDAHKYRDWVVTKEATEAAHGDKERSCYYCGAVEKADNSVHYFSEIIGIDTCGYIKMKCSSCDETTQIEDENAHVNTVWVFESVNDTCATGGEANKYCNDCDPNHESVLESAYIAANNHYNVTGITAVVTPSTCTTMGIAKGYCPDCDLNNVTAYVPSLGHIEPGHWSVAKAATCLPVDYKEGDDKSAYEGLLEKYCLRCDETIESKAIEPYAHAFTILVKGTPATCIAEGISDYKYCTICGVYVPQQVIDPSGHNFVGQVMADETSVKVCDRCFEYQVIIGKNENGEDQFVTCSCLCHNANAVGKLVYKMINFFYKLLGINQECKCGVLHYEGDSFFERLFGNK